MKRLYLVGCGCLLCLRVFTQTISPPDSLAYELYLTQIALTETLLEMGEIADAKTTLSKTDPKRRGWEWQYLSGALDRSGKSLTEHGGAAVSCVTFSPDGRLMATGGMDSTIVLWSGNDFSVSKKLKGHAGGVSTLDFSPDGRWLASGSRDKTLKIWDLSSGEVVRTLTEGLSQGIYSVKFSPDGKRLGVTSWRRDPVKNVVGFAKIYDATTGALLQNFDLDDHPVSGIDFSPDGKKALIVSWGEIAWYYDLAAEKPDWTFDMSGPEEYNAINSAEISPDGKWVALTGKDYRTRLLDAATGNLLWQIESHQGHEKWINAVRFSPDGKLVATGAEDALVQVRDAATGDLRYTLRGHTDFVHSVAFHPGGQWLVSASKDGSVKTWNLDRPGEISFDACDNGPWYLPLSADGRMAAAACSDTIIGIWNLETGRREKAFTGVSANAAAFGFDGAYLATGGHDKKVYVWNLKTDQKANTFEGHTSSVNGIAWLGARVASAGDTTVRIWNVQTKKEDKVLTIKGKYPYAVAFTLGGKQMAVGMTDGSVYLFDTKNWREIAHFQSGDNLNYLTTDASGKRLLTCGKNIYVWDLENRQLLRELKGHKSAIWGAEFHPDGQRILSCSYDHTARFWDVETGRCTLTLHRFNNELFKVGILERGKGIVVSGTSGGVEVMRF